jgi:hypothetical protein
MTTRETARFLRRTLADLEIEDEASFRHVALYAELADVLRRGGYSFRVLPERDAGRWDRALLLNLTFWGASEGGDVLVDETVPADVVAHVAWHRLASDALPAGPSGKPSADALFLGEAIASAFDLYLVGRLLGHSPDSSFLATQVPAMADAALEAGLDEAAFDALLEDVAREPEAAFEDLRALLVDATSALFSCATAEDALVALDRLGGHRFAPLLHRYELSNWVLYARAYGDPAPDERARAVDGALRDAEDSVAWLEESWLRPALTP